MTTPTGRPDPATRIVLEPGRLLPAREALAAIRLADDAIDRYTRLRAQGVDTDTARQRAAVDAAQHATPALDTFPDLDTEPAAAATAAQSEHAPAPAAEAEPSGDPWRPAAATPQPPPRRDVSPTGIDAALRRARHAVARTDAALTEQATAEPDYRAPIDEPQTEPAWEANTL